MPNQQCDLRGKRERYPSITPGAWRLEDVLQLSCPIPTDKARRSFLIGWGALQLSAMSRRSITPFTPSPHVSNVSRVFFDIPSGTARCVTIWFALPTGTKMWPCEFFLNQMTQSYFGFGSGAFHECTQCPLARTPFLCMRHMGRGSIHSDGAEKMLFLLAILT